MAKKKIDPLNKKAYGAVSAALTVADIPAAVSFYQKAFGFAKRAIMNGPDGKPCSCSVPRAQLWEGAPLRASAPRRPLCISMSKTWTK
jgi:predicted enzyme related to lactoylglutathione lyase